MAAESFVDVRYLGLELGRRLKMHEFGPETAYLEHATPMPVGSALEIETDEGVKLPAVVARVCEQVAGADRPPGMRVRRGEADEAAAAWWQALVTVEDPAAVEIPEEEVAALSGGGEDEAGEEAEAAPEAAEAAPEAAEAEAAPEDAEAPAAEEAAEAGARKGDDGELVDDGKKTELMTAVELPDDAGDKAEGQPRRRRFKVTARSKAVEPEAKASEPESSGDDTGKKKRGRRGRRKKR